jgi:hypothetical protein
MFETQTIQNPATPETEVPSLASLADIRSAIDVLFPPTQTIEVRAYGDSFPFGVRFLDHDAAAEKVKELSDGRDYTAVYYALNEFPSDITFDKPSSAVKNEQVTRRRWLFIDFDATRPQHPVEWTVNQADSKELKAEKNTKIENWKRAHLSCLSGMKFLPASN